MKQHQHSALGAFERLHVTISLRFQQAAEIMKNTGVGRQISRSVAHAERAIETNMQNIMPLSRHQQGAVFTDERCSTL